MFYSWLDIWKWSCFQFFWVNLNPAIQWKVTDPSKSQKVMKNHVFLGNHEKHDFLVLETHQRTGLWACPWAPLGPKRWVLLQKTGPRSIWAHPEVIRSAQSHKKSWKTMFPRKSRLLGLWGPRNPSKISTLGMPVVCFEHSEPSRFHIIRDHPNPTIQWKVTAPSKSQKPGMPFPREKSPKPHSGAPRAARRRLN